MTASRSPPGAVNSVPVAMFAIRAILFTLTGPGGLAMAGIRLKGEPYPPLWLALGHGAGGVAGFVALGYAWLSGGIPDPAQHAFYAFVVAALGDTTLLGLYHLQKGPLPVWMVLGHGSVGLAGLALLWAAVM
jgi:hypothetical protein